MTDHLTSKQEAALSALAKLGHQRARDALVQAVMEPVRRMARHLQWVGVDIDDIVQEGYLAVVRAVDEFSPEVGRWEPYAKAAARNAIRDMRRQRSLISTPASPRFPDYAERAQNLFLGKDLRTITYRESGKPDGGPPESAQGRELTEKNRLLAESLLAALPERSAYILRRRICDGLTLKQVAAEVGVGFVQVHRIQREALEELLQKVAAEREPHHPETGRVQQGPPADS